jgi:hypothetical protein
MDLNIIGIKMSKNKIYSIEKEIKLEIKTAEIISNSLYIEVKNSSNSESYTIYWFSLDSKFAAAYFSNNKNLLLMLLHLYREEFYKWGPKDKMNKLYSNFYI